MTTSLDVVEIRREWNVEIAECRCRCGQVTHALAADVRSGRVASCGHPDAGNDLYRLLLRRMPASWMANYRALGLADQEDRP